MRTKALILSAAVSLAAVVSSMAQTTNVYSVNAVGYISIPVPPGFSMIANQLNSTNNTLGSLFPTPPDNTQVYIWQGTGFSTYTYFAAFSSWFPDGNAVLAPGGGAFIRNAQATNVTFTFVGEVPQGQLTNSVPSGFGIVSSMVPQAGTLEPTNAVSGTGLNFVPSDQDKVLRFNNSTGNYDNYQYFTAFTAWFPSTPSVNVGEAFFSYKTGPAVNWVRTFSANN